MERELIVALLTGLISPIIVEIMKAYPRLEKLRTNVNGIISLIVAVVAWLVVEPGSSFWPWFLAAFAGGLLGAQRYEGEKRLRTWRQEAAIKRVLYRKESEGRYMGPNVRDLAPLGANYKPSQPTGAAEE